MKQVSKLFILLLSVGFLISCGGNSSNTSTTDNSSNPVAGTSASVNAPSGLTLREAPKTSGRQIALIPNNEKVSILDKNGTSEKVGGKEGRWYKVKYKDKEGYAFSAFLNEGESGESGDSGEQKETKPDLENYTSPTTEKEAIVAAPSGIRMRKLPGKDSKEVAILPYDTKVSILENTDPGAGMGECVDGIFGSWQKVKFNNKEGYVYSGYLRTYLEKDPLFRIVNTPSGVVLRDKESKNGKPIISVPNEAKVALVDNCNTGANGNGPLEKVEGKEGFWIKVKYKGKTGYLFDAFVKIIK